MLIPSMEPDIDRLSALYRYGLLDSTHSPYIQAIADKLSMAFGGMTVQIIFVDDHRLWTAASAGPSLDEPGRQGSLAAATTEQVQPLVSGDLLADSRFARAPSVLQAPRLRCYAGVALRTPDTYPIGTVAACDTCARSFEPGHVSLLERGALRIMDYLEKLRLQRIDPPTGALTGSAFHEQVAALSALSTRHRQDLSILAVDIKALRGLLQSFHAELGRLVLDRMSGLGRQNVRRIDSFGRLGESTFAVLLPNTDEAGARSLGRRIIEGLARGWSFTSADGGATAPAGIGIATLRPGLDQPDDLIGRAVRDCRRSWLNDGSSRAQDSQVA